MDIIKDKDLLLKTVASLKKVVKSKSKENNSSIKQLFSDEEATRAKVSLVVSLIKLPPIPKDGKAIPFTLRSAIPHSFVDKFTNVLLVTRNKKGFGKDPEERLNEIRDVLKDHNALDLVSEIITRHQLCTDYYDYEKRRNLAQRFDIILCDKDLYQHNIAREFGKPFYSTNKRPIPLNISAPDLRNEIKKRLSKSILHMNLAGSSSTVQIGRLDQSNKDLTENILATVESMKKFIPGGWENVRSIKLISEKSKSLSLYLSLTSPTEIPDVKPPLEVDDDEILAVEELNTLWSEDLLVRVKRSCDVDVVSASKDKRRKMERKTKKIKQRRVHYDPATNSIIKGGEVIQKEKVEKKVVVPVTPKRNKKFGKGINRKMLTKKLGPAEKFNKKKASKIKINN